MIYNLVLSQIFLQLKKMSNTKPAVSEPSKQADKMEQAEVIDDSKDAQMNNPNGEVASKGKKVIDDSKDAQMNNPNGEVASKGKKQGKKENTKGAGKKRREVDS
ncbi:uncharacterized protein A4U43_C05F18090 [Asparagus officinalis]|uniref:Uncharacterized protein n=1 Tax=Asparagus officinalis TaxID=4686 RepID=A0A5P1ESQ0_ASPOF|nr:uncharacterized protein A4U43_C05F18090 [Asparagus officinalis]